MATKQRKPTKTNNPRLFSKSAVVNLFRDKNSLKTFRNYFDDEDFQTISETKRFDLVFEKNKNEGLSVFVIRNGYKLSLVPYMEPNDYSSPPHALILKKKNNKPIIIANADEDNNELVVYPSVTKAIKNYKNVSMSFSCLEALISKCNPLEIDLSMLFQTDYNLNKLEVVKKIIVLDLYEDKYVDLNEKDKKELNKASNTANKELGSKSIYTMHFNNHPAIKEFVRTYRPDSTYSLVGEKWHRPSTVLIKYENRHFLLSIDEGQYFGVELKGQPKTIKQAYEDLKPDIIKNKKVVSEFRRQGEWFLGKVSQDSLHENCILNFTASVNFDALPSVSNYKENHRRAGERYLSIELPREDLDSALHTLTCSQFSFDSDLNCFMVRGPIELIHENEEHGPINIDDRDWYVVARNTAVRSVSVNGVD